MLTSKQQEWIDHLSDTDIISIIPFDVTAEARFMKLQERVKSLMGKDIILEHHGATSLGISGQDEIDVYMPVEGDQFNLLLDQVRAIFGTPGSLYPFQRARFTIKEDDKRIDIFLINKNTEDWRNLIKFENRLKADPKILEGYMMLKERGNGLAVREYYRRKIEFINDIIQ